MFKRSGVPFALATLLLGFACSMCLAASPEGESRLDQYTAEDGATYFAVRLAPNVEIPAPGACTAFRTQWSLIAPRSSGSPGG